MRKDKDASYNILLKAKHDVALNQKLYEMIKKIASVMEFTSPLIKEFLHQLDRLCYKDSLTLKLGKEVPEYFICPIKLDVMDDPVITQCTHTFERMEILYCFTMNKSKVIECPCCGESIQENNLINNTKLKLVIERWKKENDKKSEPFDQKIEKQEAPCDIFASLENHKKLLEEKIESLKLSLTQTEIEYSNVLADIEKLKSQFV